MPKRAALILLMLLAVGCGTAKPPASGGGSAPGQPTIVPPDSGGTIVSPAPEPSTGDGDTVSTEPGKVVVRLGSGSYSEGAVIEATIANGLDATVFAQDEKSACTIAWLERQDGDTWTPMAGCTERRPFLVLAIGPGHGRVVEFAPGGTNGPFPPGTYRIRFTYSMESESGAEPLAASSAPFGVG